LSLINLNDETLTVYEVERAVNHCLCLQQFLELNIPFALFVDDEVVNSKLREKYLKMMYDIDNYDVLVLGWNGKKNGNKVFPTYRGIRRISAYIVNRKMAQDFLTYSYPINMPIDYSLQATSDMLGKRIKIFDESLPFNFTYFLSFSSLFTLSVYLNFLALCVFLFIFYEL
jgi:GR25 family glycosyltransferase involved in LPS biosynthesis